MTPVFKAISIIILSTVKHTLGGIPAAAALQMSFPEIFIYTFVGGMVGVVFFMFAYASIAGFFTRKFPKTKSGKNFIWKNKFIVRIKRNFGLPGIAFFTPFLLSIPVGTIIACMYYKDKKRVLLSIGLSVMGWSLIGGAIANQLATTIAG